MNRLNEQMFVLADPQFGCPYVFEYVPARKLFGWVELLDQEIIQNWNEIVSPLDTVLCLGDFMNGNHSIDESIRRLDSFSRQLNGKKILLRGNHDNIETAKYYDSGWQGLIEYPLVLLDGQMKWLNVPSKYCACIITDVAGKRLMFSHFGIFDEDEDDPRYLIEKAYLRDLFIQYQCDLNIHGHTHDRHISDERCVNACMEQTHFKPVRLNQFISNTPGDKERKIA